MQICGTSMHFHCLIVIFIKLCYILLITKCNEVSHFSSMCTVLHSVSIEAREKALCITPGLVFFHTLTHKLQLYNYFIIKITPNIQSIFRSTNVMMTTSLFHHIYRHNVNVSNAIHVHLY